jgi:cytoskeletal protein RodZ
MKSIHHRKRSKKKPIILAIVLAAAILAGAAYFYWSQPGATTEKGDTNIDYSPPSDEQTKGEETAEQQTGSSDTPSDQTNDSSDQKASVGVEITSANQNGSTLQIRTLVQLVTNEGECTVTLTKSGSKPITKTAGVQAATTYSTCQGFNISTSGMEAGTWNISLTFANASYTGTTTGKVDIIN